jgi:putative serine protease PepD
MSASDPPDEAGIAGSRPDPLDRLWRHPSELSGNGGGVHSTPNAPRGVWPLLGLGVGSAVFGSLLTIGILGMSGLLSGPPKPTIRDRLLTVAKDDARTDAADAVRPAMVEINYRGANGPAKAAGFCIKQGGLILTSAEVTGKPGTVSVISAKGESFSAIVIGVDATSGLAVLSTEGSMPVASLATAAPKAGDSVIVIGSGATIGEGIVNSTDAVAVSKSGVALPNLLITSALPINNVPGSALVNGQGKIAGVVIAGNLGAVPIDYARSVIDFLTDHSVASHAWVGIHGKDSSRGPVITSVDAASPAAYAGLKRGDVITQIDGRATLSMKDLQAMIRWRWARDEIVFSVTRSRAPLEVTLTAMRALPAPNTANTLPSGASTTASVTAP